MPTRCLGLFGGTFDPPHLGHVRALQVAWASQLFSEILVTVAGDPYRKSAHHAVTPATHRLAMAHAAFDGLAGVRVSDRELRRSGPTYTIDTVRELVSEGWTVELLIGEDAATTLDEWHAASDLAALVTIGIFPRGTPVTLSEKWRVRGRFDMEPVDLSSSGVRQMLYDGHLEDVLPAGVIPLYQHEQG